MTPEDMRAIDHQINDAVVKRLVDEIAEHHKTIRWLWSVVFILFAGCVLLLFHDSRHHPPGPDDDPPIRDNR